MCDFSSSLWVMHMYVCGAGGQAAGRARTYCALCREEWRRCGYECVHGCVLWFFFFSVGYAYVCLWCRLCLFLWLCTCARIYLEFIFFAFSGGVASGVMGAAPQLMSAAMGGGAGGAPASAGGREAQLMQE